MSLQVGPYCEPQQHDLAKLVEGTGLTMDTAAKRGRIAANWRGYARLQAYSRRPRSAALSDPGNILSN